MKNWTYEVLFNRPLKSYANSNINIEHRCMERKDEIKPSKIPFVFSVLIMLNELYPSKGHCYIVNAAFNCNTWALLHAFAKSKVSKNKILPETGSLLPLLRCINV